MKKKIKLVKIEHKEKCAKNDAWRIKILKELREIIHEDFGEECEVWDEVCIICEAYRALAVLERIYEIQKYKK